MKITIVAVLTGLLLPHFVYANDPIRSGLWATRIGNSYKMDLHCKNAQFQGNGTAQGTFTTPESFVGSSEFDSTVNGTPLYASAEIKARWIGGQCSAVNLTQ